MKLLNEINTNQLLQEKKNGRYVSLPFNVISGERSELTEKVRAWLREYKCPYVLKNENEAEDLLYAISCKLSEGNLTMPIDTSYDYFIKVNQTVILHIEAADEYLGSGEFEIYACISGLIVTSTITKEEVDEAVNLIKMFED